MTYETYVPAAAGLPAQPTSEAGAGPWKVAIEYSNQGQAKPPTIVQIGSTDFTRHKDALAAARRTAFEHNPPDPWSPQGRQVFQDGPDAFLVIIEGATTTFHMSVRLVVPLVDAG